jgi:hypothetical protein
MLRIGDLNARGNTPMMPAQLARAKRPKRSTPRPIVEQLPRIDIAISISIPEKPSYLAANHRSESPFGLYSINSIALDSHRLRRQLPSAPAVHLQLRPLNYQIVFQLRKPQMPQMR